MNVVITGTSSGIGEAIAERFLENDCTVYGLDIKPISQRLAGRANYIHCSGVDVSKKETLPDIKDVDILINNAGVQNEEISIEVNLRGTINATEKYGLQPGIKSILNVVSVSAHNGAEFPVYTASKGGMLAYTKWTATQVAKYGATCNSISPGGVITDLNEHILKDEKLWNAVLGETMLNKWASADEIADWAYFMTVVNKSATSIDVIVDNGETSKTNFIW